MRYYTYWHEKPGVHEMPKAIEYCLNSMTLHLDCPSIGSKFECFSQRTFEEQYPTEWRLVAHQPIYIQSDYFRLLEGWNRGGTWLDADCLVVRNPNFDEHVVHSSDDGTPLTDFIGVYNPHLQGKKHGKSLLANPFFTKPKGVVVGRALKLLEEMLRSPTPITERPYAITSKGILTKAYRLSKKHNPGKHKQRLIKRVQHWRYHRIPWTKVDAFLRRETYENHLNSCFYDAGRTAIYHLTGKAVDLLEKPLVSWKSRPIFFQFLISRAFQIHVRPGRSQEIMNRIPMDREIHGVEIGVGRCRNSVQLLDLCPNLRLITVDPMAPHDNPEYKATGDDYASMGLYKWRMLRRAMENKLAFAKDRHQHIYKRSIPATQQFPNGGLDFVFIDGDHSYTGVYYDMVAWWDKIKPGGWIGGHDYGHKHNRYGVDQAVRDFIRNRPDLSPDDLVLGMDHTWFIRIPRKNRTEAKPCQTK